MEAQVHVGNAMVPESHPGFGSYGGGNVVVVGGIIGKHIWHPGPGYTSHG